MGHAGTQAVAPITAYYAGSDTIKNGNALCYDYDNSDASLRESRVEKPTLAALLNGGFAGVVVNAPSTGIVGDGSAKAVNIIPASYFKTRNVDVLTDENVAVGDLLGPIPESYNFGRAVIPGCAYFRAAEAQDRSSTAGKVNGTFGYINVDDHPDKILKLDDHFLSALISATADLNRYIFTANSGTATLLESVAGGVLSVVSASTTETSVVQNGEPWSLAAGKSIFFRVRMASSPLTDGEDCVVGLALYDVAAMASLPTDYIWFRMDGAASPVAKIEYVKDGTTGAVSSEVGAAVSGTYYDLAFFVRNRATGTSGQKSIQVWRDLVSVAHTTTQTEVPDDELLTICMAAQGGEATTLNVDRIQCLMNL